MSTARLGPVSATTSPALVGRGIPHVTFGVEALTTSTTARPPGGGHSRSLPERSQIPPTHGYQPTGPYMGPERTQAVTPASHPPDPSVSLQPTALGLGGHPQPAAYASRHEYHGVAMSGGLGTTPVGAGGAACLTLPGDGVAGSRPTQAPAPIFPMPFVGQIPQIPWFTGEGHASSDSFSEWHEHFENIAKLVGWDDHWRLVHFCGTQLHRSIARVGWMCVVTTGLWWWL